MTWNQQLQNVSSNYFPYLSLTSVKYLKNFLLFSLFISSVSLKHLLSFAPLVIHDSNSADSNSLLTPSCPPPMCPQYSRRCKFLLIHAFHVIRLAHIYLCSYPFSQGLSWFSNFSCCWCVQPVLQIFADTYVPHHIYFSPIFAFLLRLMGPTGCP